MYIASVNRLVDPSGSGFAMMQSSASHMGKTG